MTGPFFPAGADGRSFQGTADGPAGGNGDILPERDFRRLADVIESHCGIRLPPAKRVMVEGRLRRRVRALALGSVHDYCRFLFDKGGLEQEFTHLIDAVTTNKTDFFREPEHFNWMRERILAELCTRTGAGRDRPMTVWSAACSTGPEPYTLAMVLSEFAAASPGFRFQVYATDISSEVLATAVKAIYHEEEAGPIPDALRRKYLLRSRDRSRPQVRVAPELRKMVRFAQMNLLEDHCPWRQPMDIIFCRNVLIYFDKPTQQRVLDHLCRRLTHGGFLFLGHSESLTALSLPVDQVAPAIYRRR